MAVMPGADGVASEVRHTNGMGCGVGFLAGSRDRDHSMDKSRMPDGAAEDTRKGTSGELREERRIGARELTHWKSPAGQRLANIGHWISVALGPKKALVLMLVIGAAVAATMTWLTSELYESVQQANGVALLDRPTLRVMMRLRSPGWDLWATDFTNIGGVVVMPILAVVIMVSLALLRRSWTPIILITAAGAGSLLMTVAGKQLLGRARPPLADAVPLAVGVLMHRHSLPRQEAWRRLQRMAHEHGLNVPAQAERLLGAVEELARSG